MKPRAATSISHWLFLLVFLCTIRSHAEDGYRLWLRYDRIGNAGLLQQYRNTISSCQVNDHDPALKVAGEELIIGMQGLLDMPIARIDAALALVPEGCIIAGTPSSSAAIRQLHLEQRLAGIGDEGFVIVSIRTLARAMRASRSRQTRAPGYFMASFIFCDCCKRNRISGNWPSAVRRSINIVYSITGTTPTAGSNGDMPVYPCGIGKHCRRFILTAAIPTMPGQMPRSGSMGPCSIASTRTRSF